MQEKSIKKEITLETIFERMEKRFDGIQKDIDTLAGATARGFAGVDVRMDGLENRIDDVETGLGSLGERIGDVEENLTNRIQGLERRIDNFAETKANKEEVRIMDKRVLKIEKNLGFA